MNKNTKGKWIDLAQKGENQGGHPRSGSHLNWALASEVRCGKSSAQIEGEGHRNWAKYLGSE